MSTDIDNWISAELERSFATEPPLRDPREYAARGRRVRRRRRVAVGAVGVASVAAMATLALGGARLGDTPDRGVEPAAVVPEPVTAAVPVDPRQAQKCAAGLLGVCDGDIGTDDIHLDRSGRLLRGYSYDVVTGAYQDVLPDTPDPDVSLDSSAAVELTVRGRTVWALLRLDVGATSSSLQYAAPDPTRTFDEWVRDSVADGEWFSHRPDPDGPGERVTQTCRACEGSTPR